jgi:hypothetical protein
MAQDRVQLLSPSGRLFVLMMEAVSTSEKSVNFYKTTRRNIPEGCHHNCRRENLISYPVVDPSFSATVVLITLLDGACGENKFQSYKHGM